MRIGIVGSAGCGKTTLAHNLASHLQVPYIQDHVLGVLRENGRDSWRGVNDVVQRRRIREEALKRKISAETEHDAFVSDKTVIDYLAYWLQNQSEHEERHNNQAFVDQCRAAAARYDVLVFLPYREQVDFAVGRNQDPTHNLKVAAHKRGLLALWNLPVVEAPYAFSEDIGPWFDRHLARFAPPPAAEPTQEVEP